MINDLCYNFLKDKNEKTGYELLYYLRTKSKFELGIIIGEMLEKMFPHSYSILLEYSVCCYYGKKYEKSYDLNEHILKFKLNE